MRTICLHDVVVRSDGIREEFCCGPVFGPAGNLNCWNAEYTAEAARNQ